MKSWQTIFYSVLSAKLKKIKKGATAVTVAESEEDMKDWQVSYYLDDMFHCYVIEAENEYDATLKLLNSIPKGSHKLFRDLKVARKKVDWN